MKIILSRKGFDSENGGQPNPILPSGELLSLPIPSKDDKIYYKDIIYNGMTYYEIIKELNSRTKIKDTYTCHLDPDIREESIKRVAGWRGLFGQQGSSEGHLRNNNIEVGDLFLFFGWFRETEYYDGKLRYCPNAPDLHILFGYLQIGKIIRKVFDLPKFAIDHPHAVRFNQNNNGIYIASEKLLTDHTKPGYGVFNVTDQRILTMKGRNRSQWNLPDIFRDVTITYHTKESFKTDGVFESAKKGQEFIIFANDRIVDYVFNAIL